MDKMEQQASELELIQMPFRCRKDLHEDIIRALGLTMSKSGKKMSKNEFIIRLVELGLSQMNKLNVDKA